MAKRANFDDVTLDVEGNALSGVEVSVYYEAGSLATIYSAKTGGGTKSNPITTGTNGLVQFWAEPGSYRLDVHDPTIPARISDRSVYWDSVSGDTTGGISGTQLEDSGVTLAKLAAALQEYLVPVGVIFPYAGDQSQSAPTGFLYCDGTGKSTSTYSALFAKIGYTFGGSGGTFNMPDLRGRAPVGVDGGAGRITANNTRGASSGAQSHVLSVAELASHNHGGLTGANGGHYHTVGTYSLTDSNFNYISRSSTTSYTGYSQPTSTEPDHQHSIPSNGSGSAHNNLQPYLTIGAFIIKY